MKQKDKRVLIGSIYRLPKPRTWRWPDWIVLEVQGDVVIVRNYHTESGTVGPTTSSWYRHSVIKNERIGKLSKKVLEDLFPSKKKKRLTFRLQKSRILLRLFVILS
jgi:hypothetical protein